MQYAKTTSSALEYGYEHDQGKFIGLQPCEQCPSSDAMAVYDNSAREEGSYAHHCFSCGYHKVYTSDGTDVVEATLPVNLDKKATNNDQLLPGHHAYLKDRKITEETCAFYDYRIVDYKGSKAHAATFYDLSGNPIAQKIRTRDKDFAVIGQTKKLPLYGSHRFGSGKKIVITEGEIDMMSVSQVQGNKWPTVSLPQGAQGAVKAIKDNWDYLENFEEVILMFDMDEAGRQAAKEVCEVLPLGKAKIAVLPYKDANECLVKGKANDIINAIWSAQSYRPDGIVSAADIRTIIAQDDAASAVTYPYPRLNELTKGLREGELVVITAGSGIGKSTMVREIAYHLHNSGEKVGMIMLEESNKRTILGLLGIHLNKNVTVDRSLTNEAELYAAFDELFPDEDNQVYLYDHFGSTDVDVICNRIQFMVKAMGVKWVILDHISILISGLAVADERKLIDMAMTKLRTLVQELDIGLLLVSHLRRPEGDKGHEDGSKVRLGQLRGSHAIAQLADQAIGLQVDSDDPDSDMRHIHLLKNRFTGETGHAGIVTYNRQTGRLLDEGMEF